MKIGTLSELFLVAADHNKPDCLLHKVGGTYVPISTAELVDRVRRLANALLDLGVERGDRVALMAENGPHWPTVDFAVLSIGAVLVPIYPTLTPDQAAYVANDCGARIAFIDGRQRLEGLLAEKESMPEIEKFILIGGDASEPDTLSYLIDNTDPMDAEKFEQSARSAKPDDLATFIYTSGTTGNPKGVMLSHGNITSNVVDSLNSLDIRPGMTALSFLPLSHSFERTVDYIYFYVGVAIAYAESVQDVAKNLGEVNPHVFVSVPRVYEKVLAKVRDNVSNSSGLKQKIFHWAEGVGSQAISYRLRQEKPPGLLGIKLGLADKLVLGKIRERLGNRFLFAVSGGAPLARDLAEFFWGAGIRIYEGYGLSETSPVLTVNATTAVKMGAVGKAIPGVTLHIADDGEILAKGPNIMKGYWNLPEKTAEAIDPEGWFHTGDIGVIDEEGFLKITDRKKEIIVNAYGKNVAPAPIENALKASRLIGQAVVIGDRKKYLSALLVPDFEALDTWAKKQDLGDLPASELIDTPAVKETFQAEVEKVNKDLARYEQIRRWELLPEDFTIETGELTPTQKIKRRVIHDKYAETIALLYTDDEA